MNSTDICKTGQGICCYALENTILNGIFWNIIIRGTLPGGYWQIAQRDLHQMALICVILPSLTLTFNL